ncbi:hypothetical protein CHLNCDRAFT_22673 [Chlorella variabilis]|uniref:Rhodanese domain-containing protein n=1 Tax=Chlorella variabilis TaxID=554065 RepID=E1ZDX5_CHLVA|nr:hypothetical protein CHLNCDRAFT_22673 [Chlorella variabilis]EFN55933.1 hypothetical protein CHLNCDRAFT_22673 [Chlorella variabilis]|eukprot:XP_005848035.1 hypothetical protein CHLNCDRAFT_22673 [Chlorella variabilis]
MSGEKELGQLREQNARLQAEVERLKAAVAGPGQQGAQAAAANGAAAPDGAAGSFPAWDGLRHGLSKDQIARYSRQIVLHSFGVQAQARLCRGSVLIVGAGGLGSPAALYLAAAGVGRIGVVDKDSVELSNIHRQIIHRRAPHPPGGLLALGPVGVHKAVSAAEACRALNSSIQVETHLEGLTPANAVHLVRQYDVVVDASDNAPTRYLIRRATLHRVHAVVLCWLHCMRLDACCAVGRPLVSGAAIGTDGQLTVYCHGHDGPCYRCLFPEAPAAGNCARCVDAGVLGVVPGGRAAGVQALEAVKLLSGVGDPLSRRLLVVDCAAGRFHSVKLRAKSANCVACSTHPSITAASVAAYDYAAFTGQAATNDAAPAPLQLIAAEERITPAELQQRLASEPGCVLLDVRPAEQYNVCHLPGAQAALLWPHSGAPSMPPSGGQGGGGGTAGASRPPAHPPLYVVCRRGNDSQRAVARLRELGMAHAVDVVGGMEAWAHEVDPGFPTY